MKLRTPCDFKFNAGIFFLITSICVGCVDLDQLEMDRKNSFIKLYGGAAEERGHDLIQTTDGGFLLLGSAQSAGNTEVFDMYVVKTDPEGNEEWSRFIDADDNLVQGNDYGRSISPTQDGAYLLAGYTTRADNTEDAFIVKIRENNLVEWKRVINKPGSNEQIYDVVEASNNDIVLVGMTSEKLRQPEDPDRDLSNMLWLRLDPNGQIKIDSAVVGFTGMDEGRAVLKKGDNFLIVGTTDKPMRVGEEFESHRKVWVVELGAQGGFVNPQEFPSDKSFEAEGVDIIQQEGGNIVVLANAINQGSKQGWVFQLDTNLTEFSKSYFLDVPGDSDASGINQNVNGEWVISGTQDQGGRRMYLQVLSAQSGLVIPKWSTPRDFGFPGGTVQGAQVIPVGGDQYGIIGTSSFGNDNTLMVFIKTLSNGTLK